MKKKSIVVICLVMILSLMVCACGKSGGAAENSTDDFIPKQGESIKIGMLGNLFASGEPLTVQEYYTNVIAPNFPQIEFIYSTSFNNTEDEKNAIEGLITQGVDGIIAIDAYDFAGLIDTCADNDVYLAMCIHNPAESDLEYMEDDPNFQKYFLGCIGQSNETEYDAGYRTAKQAMADILEGTIAVFGKKGYVEDAYAYQNLQGAFDALDEDGRFNEENFFEVNWDDNTVMTLGSNLLSTNPAGVVATNAAPDLLCGSVSTHKAEDITQVYGVGFVSKTYKTFMENGSLDWITCVYADQTCGAFALMYNWLNNGVRWSAEDRNYAYGDIPYIDVPDAETMSVWLEYCGTADKSPFIFEDVKTMLVEYNEDASLEDTMALLEQITLEEVQARRGN